MEKLAGDLLFESKLELCLLICLLVFFPQGPTLAYDGLHDRSLKHYYKDNNIKRHLQKMSTASGQESRETSVRNFVDETMASVDYRLKPGPVSPYAIPQMVKPKPPSRRPKALISVDEYFNTKKGAKRRYTVKLNLVQQKNEFCHVKSMHTWAKNT